MTSVNLRSSCTRVGYLPCIIKEAARDILDNFEILLAVLFPNTTTHSWKSESDIYDRMKAGSWPAEISLKIIINLRCRSASLWTISVSFSLFADQDLF